MDEQLALFSLPDPYDDEEAELLALGILRHGIDLSDHARGYLIQPWDSGNGRYRAGDLVPAILCCQCGEPEPNEFWLDNGHACGDNVEGGCYRQRLLAEGRDVGPYRWQLATPEQITAGGAS